MNIPRDLVDVFRRELETTRSLDAAVAAVATAVLARVDAPTRRTPPPPLPAPPPPPPVQLRGLPSAPEPRPAARLQVSRERVAAVKQAVAEYYQMKPHLIFDRRWSTRCASGARWVTAAILRRMGMCKREIAEHVGLADHSTVVYGLRQVESRPDLAEQAETVWRQVNQGVAAAAQVAEAAA
jgi:hypothetical protein